MLRALYVERIIEDKKETTMKRKTIFFSILLLAAILLSACTAAESADALDQGSTATTDEGNESSVNADSPEVNASDPSDQYLRTRLADGETPLAMMLILGIFKLEKTNFAIDSAQAAVLLPLWKALRSLSESETVAAEEIQAIIDQIQDTMTAEQIAAIESMDLTMQDLGVIAEELGLELDSFGGRFAELSPEMQATREAARESGQFPGGGQGTGPGGGIPGSGPGGGQGFGSGELSPEARQTAIAERGGVRGAQLGVNPFLLEAVIEFLEAKL
jgi:hypothetical protein